MDQCRRCIQKYFQSGKKITYKEKQPSVCCKLYAGYRPDYRVGVPKKKQYKLIMNEHGLLEKPEVFKAEVQECDHREFSFDYPLPGYGVAVFTY